MSMVDFKNKINFIGSWHLEKKLALWKKMQFYGMIFFSNIDIVSYGPNVYLS